MKLTRSETQKMENTKRETAQILQFPTGGKAGLKRQRDEQVFASEYREAVNQSIVFGGAWYHEEAVTDPKSTREH